MKNKRLAIFLGIFVFLALVVVLSSAIFALDSVGIVYHSTTNILTGDDKIIVEAGQFRYGENVFLSNKTQYIQNIESAFPYIRVLNIETVFPNKYKIHAVEREETYVFKTDNYYIITDENLKVLTKQKTFSNSIENAIVVENSEYSNSIVQAGEFLSNAEYLKNVFVCFREWKIDYAEVKQNIKTIQVNYVDGLNSGDGNLLITTWDGVEILISNSTKNMSDKINYGFSAYDYLPTKTGRITVIENSNGQITGIYKS